MSPFNGFIVAHPENEILYNGTKKTKTFYTMNCFWRLNIYWIMILRQ